MNTNIVKQAGRFILDHTSVSKHMRFKCSCLADQTWRSVAAPHSWPSATQSQPGQYPPTLALCALHMMALIQLPERNCRSAGCRFPGPSPGRPTLLHPNICQDWRAALWLLRCALKQTAPVQKSQHAAQNANKNNECRVNYLNQFHLRTHSDDVSLLIDLVNVSSGLNLRSTQNKLHGEMGMWWGKYSLSVLN